MSKLYDESHRALQPARSTPSSSLIARARLCAAAQRRGSGIHRRTRSFCSSPPFDSAVGRLLLQGRRFPIRASPDEPTLVFPNYDGRRHVPSMGTSARLHARIAFLISSSRSACGGRKVARIVPVDALRARHPGDISW